MNTTITINKQSIMTKILFNTKKKIVFRVENQILYVSAPKTYTVNKVVNIIKQKENKILELLNQSLWFEIDVNNHQFRLFGLIQSYNHQWSEKEIKDYCWEVAQSYLMKRTQFWIDYIQCPVKSVTIKHYRSSWGRCTSDQRVFLNARLIHYPKEFIDAVIVHECVHCFTMNHSKEFKKTVIKIYPQYSQVIYDQKNRMKSTG